MFDRIPAGFHTLTPTLVLSDAGAAIKLYVRIFSAIEEYAMVIPVSGRIAHACLRFGDSKLFLRDIMEITEETTSNSRLYVYVDDVNMVCRLAVANGFEQIIMPPEDMFWGDRLGMLRDRFGITWIVATHEHKVSALEMEIGRQDFLRVLCDGKKLPASCESLEAVHEKA